MVRGGRGYRYRIDWRRCGAISAKSAMRRSNSNPKGAGRKPVLLWFQLFLTGSAIQSKLREIAERKALARDMDIVHAWQQELRAARAEMTEVIKSAKRAGMPPRKIAAIRVCEAVKVEQCRKDAIRAIDDELKGRPLAIYNGQDMGRSRARHLELVRPKGKQGKSELVDALNCGVKWCLNRYRISIKVRRAKAALDYYRELTSNKPAEIIADLEIRAEAAELSSARRNFCTK
jgi:hypothetical protein